MAAQQQQQSKFAANTMRFMVRALKTLNCGGAQGARVNPDTKGCVWAGEFILNTLCVDREIPESGKKMA